MDLTDIKQAIIDDEENLLFSKNGWNPIYTANEQAKILIVGQAPSRIAQAGGLPWNDLSGDNLRSWLGVSKEEFYNENIFAFLPMDFYFPGSEKNGDIPPRKGFAEKWHPVLLAQMPNIKLIVLIGKYSQNYYLGNRLKQNLTQTVLDYKEYLPKFLPLVHPSPRNNIWQKKNQWFKEDLVPNIHNIIKNILDK